MKPQKNREIGVFDSGVGGLSILYELQKVLPHENFIYLADSLHAPYGEKSKRELTIITSKIVEYFLSQNVKLVVIACNTATARAINALRKKYSVSMVGTIPAVKIAVLNTKSKTIAILSTLSTSKSPALKKLIKEYTSDIKVLNIACPGLSNAVESGNLNTPQTNKLLQEYLNDIKNSDTDQLVFGCTHYPFLEKNIRKILGKKVTFIDSASAIAKQVKNILKKNKLQNSAPQKGTTTYLTTGNPAKFSIMASKLLKRRIKSTQITF